MPLFLLGRDGVVVVNRKDNIKTPAGLQLIAGAAEAVARLNAAGFDVAICTNQPEVARGAMSHDELDAVHEALTKLQRNDIGRLPVVDRHNPRQLLGYLGRAALLEARLRRHDEESVIEPGWLQQMRPSSKNAVTTH